MTHEIIVSEERIGSKIYLIRDRKVMLDRDLADLYEVKTRILKQAVRRNINRFPEDFMFQMTQKELELWRSQIVMSNGDKKGLRHAPFCFTEQGIAQLSSVLNSEKAVQANIQIIRLFTRMREMMLTHKDLIIKMEELEKKVSEQDGKMLQVLKYLKQFVKEQQAPRQKIGFK